MQYPPQQPTNWPNYPPSEIYLPEQPPGSEQSQTPAQEIAIYINRRQAIPRAVVCVIGLLILILLIPLMAILSALAGQPVGLGDITPLLIIVIPATAFVGWISWGMLSMLFAPKPLLRINNEGIIVGPIPMFSGFSISWGEIGALLPGD